MMTHDDVIDHRVMVGRTAKDCLRFLQDKELGKYPVRAKLLANAESAPLPPPPLPAASSRINLIQRESSSSSAHLNQIKSEPGTESEVSSKPNVSLAASSKEKTEAEKSSVKEEVWPHQRIVYEPRGICLKFFRHTGKKDENDFLTLFFLLPFFLLLCLSLADAF